MSRENEDNCNGGLASVESGLASEPLATLIGRSRLSERVAYSVLMLCMSETFPWWHQMLANVEQQ
jgi:hypothetical protein